MTIKDIARLSGCGVATVSRVLNNRLDVSEETRQKVMAVVEEYDFQPNNNAKHLKQQAGTSIAILVKGTQNILFADLVEQLQALLLDSNRDVAVYYLDEDANEVAYTIQLCREHKPMGVFFLGGDLEYFQSAFDEIAVPCVLLTNTAQDLRFNNLSSLTTDDEQAAFEALNFLMDKGHRKIGVLGGNQSVSQISYRRIQGCYRAFTSRGLSFDVQRCAEPCRYSLSDAYAATKRLFLRCPELTAIFAMSDVVAIGAIRALRDMGKCVPEDISVMGYDGLSIGRYSIPRLTTIRQDTYQMAAQGVKVLLHNIEQKNRPVHKMVPFQVIAGESVFDLKQADCGSPLAADFQNN